MYLKDEVAAIRSSAALSRSAHVTAVRVSGSEAFDALDGVCPRELYIQEGQALHTLFLDDEGHAVADVYVCAGAEDFLILGETRSGTVMDHLRDRIGRAPNVELVDLSATHEVLSLNGPYAWEVLADVLTPELIGLPYLGFFDMEGLTCLRAGKAGEYGYDLLVPRENVEALVARITECGRAFDLGTASLEALDACALENWFFNVRREGTADVTPLELQLQWRVSYRRNYPGSAALLARRRAGPTRRVVLVAATTDLAVGDSVAWAEPLERAETIGELIAAGPSYTLGRSLGLALLDAPLAHAGIVGFVAVRGTSRIPLRTLSAPAVNNRSLYVDPQRHSYHTREADAFPPIEALV